MSSTKQFTEAVRDWTALSMHRSMLDFGRFMRTAGLSQPQVNTLMRLYYRPICTVSDIGGQLGITNAAASQLVERMVRQGLLERTECAGDRRMKELHLTAKGRRLVEHAIDARHRWLNALRAHLTHEEQVTIVAGLASLTKAAQELEGDASARIGESKRLESGLEKARR